MQSPQSSAGHTVPAQHVLAIIIIVFASGNLVCPGAKLSPESASWLQRSFQPASCLGAPGPLHFSCLSSFVSSLKCQLPSALPAAKLPPPPLIGVVPSYLAATLGPSSSTAPWEQQSMGRNSLPDRWTHGGWAASAELPRKPETRAEPPWLPPK